jgi:hypothetical protein
MGEPNSSFTNGGTLYPNTLYLIDTTSSSMTGTLSTSVEDGQIVSILDVGGNFDINSFTVQSGTGNTIKTAASYTCNKEDGFYMFIYYEADND